MITRLGFACLFILCSTMISASPVHAVKLSDLDADFGIQYRVMYNSSNIGTLDRYDFFRQRLRINLDVRSEQGVGGFAQYEYRGGWGGTSPAESDPRGGYAINPFNRIQARGVRYGYLYFPLGPGSVNAGILPLNDQVDQMLFSADWDLNIGGVSYAGKTDVLNWRAAFVRLVDGAFYRSSAAVNDEDVNFYIVDVNTKLGEVDLGLHLYGIDGRFINDPDDPPLSDGDETTEKTRDIWVGAHGAVSMKPLAVRAVILHHDEESGVDKNDGVLARVEVSGAFGPVRVSILGIDASGEDGVGGKKGFQTFHGKYGTNGYWAYTYIFTPHGPSDVNDFGLEAGNRGYGLTTIQAKVDVPISKTINGQLVFGTFRAKKDMDVAAGAPVGKKIGSEVGGQIAINLGKNMNLEVGAAWASLGEAGKAVYNGVDKKSINEVFSRLQLEF